MLRFVLLTIILASVSCRKPKETTHSLLSRLGFDPVHKPGVNYHQKRVADESDKARHSPNDYNSDTDSHMFVVRLPPHNNFYRDVQAEKLENEVLPKRPMHFASNGKPAQVYHWNIPLMKKLAKHKVKSSQDSNIFHLKILPNEQEKVYNFYKQLLQDGKPSLYKHKSKEHVMSIAELAEHQNDRPVVMKKSKKSPQKSKFSSKSKNKADSHLTHVVTHKKRNGMNKKAADTGDSKVTFLKPNFNEILKGEESKGPVRLDLGLKQPHVYSPALPKDNSFFKFFEGNGKPKSFYVIEKGDNTSRLHRVL